ncbi:Protein CfxQ [Symbiodinium microadriaticum]|uniref:Protein CfxQ n=1 Tax=Symbiodinium microadriaticum TaxID=2951 RepID=A0A1Q9EID4_SYMMI|nr:Protein CfxQ [Symbiodinium microadriaticum]
MSAKGAFAKELLLPQDVKVGSNWVGTWKGSFFVPSKITFRWILAQGRQPDGDNGRDRTKGGQDEGGGGGVANFAGTKAEAVSSGGNNGRGVKAVSGAGSEGDGGDDVECGWAKRRQQGRPGGDNGRGVKVVSGGGRKIGDSVKWVGKALRVAGLGTHWSEDEGGDWGSVGEALRAVWVDPAAPTDLLATWEEMKETKGCASEAMDQLLALTGLKKVKMKAMDLYKSALQFQRMDPEKRKKNAPNLNYCFMGNPGTGKTTVARLFAAVLHDSGLRSKNVFQECTAQKLKDGGVDEFRKLAQEALDGVIFIDEAYDLDPAGDKFKGAPIVNELVTLTENERARLTCILAGYEDDMNSKIFAYNTGLKSRFTEVHFEDFDEKELAQIWTHMRSQRGWSEEDSRLTDVVVRRMAKSRGKKGFGNAREVRKCLEAAAESAMSHSDFDPQAMSLRFVDVVGEDPRSNPKLQHVRDEIERKTGWRKIKKTIDELITICGTNYHKELNGEKPLPVFLNRMFLGNPGTGKTTCAKLYGELLKNLGFLNSGDVVFKTAGDLGGSVVGEAQQKVLGVLQSAAGKVLVIDEAYNLNDGLYGKQVLDVLVEKIQGGDNDDIAVLLLGYEDQMLSMLREQNPGLARRFPPEQAFYFEDYTDQELMDILRNHCRSEGVKPSLDFQEKAKRKLDMLRRSESHFGNAGAVMNLVKAAMLKASSRGQGEGPLCLEASDIDIGPEAENQKDPFAPLEKLYRMEGIRQKLQQLSNAFSVASEEGDEAPELGHFVFTGAPGTGKTTVARVMAQILFQLRLLAKDRVQETSGLNLTGEYLGQTKKKVEEQLEAAKGGVLFIDEAYELGKGLYGQEACTAIVAAMTDPKYAGVVIIIAGYPGDINAMLDTNPGLKSRFTHFFEFPDWTAGDCLDLIQKRAASGSFGLAPEAVTVLQEGFGALRGLDGWGNARDVDKVWKECLQQRADRVVKKPEGAEKTLQESDVRPAIQKLLAARGPKAAPTVPSFPGDARCEMPSQAQEKPVQSQKQAQREEEAPAEAPGPADVDERDPGVSDEDWQELQRAKEAYAQEEERVARELHELEERLRAEAAQREEELRRELEAELRRLEALAAEKAEQERLEAQRIRAKAELEARLERERLERERRRLEEEARIRAEQEKQARIREKLRQISPCPAGFSWYKTGGGWRCGGGSHFVSDSQLNAHFTH